MKQTSGPAKKPAEAVIKDLRRATRRQFHAVTGLVAGGGLFFLAATGLPWSIWWDQQVRTLSNEAGVGQPQALWANKPVSNVPMREMLTTTGWAMEDAPVPVSNPSAASAIGLARAVEVLRGLGMPPGFEISLPVGETGVYAAAAYPKDVTAQRMITLDQYTGKPLVDVRFADLGGVARAVQYGIGIHKGEHWGRANHLAMLAFCLATILLSGHGRGDVVEASAGRPPRRPALAARPSRRRDGDGHRARPRRPVPADRPRRSRHDRARSRCPGLAPAPSALSERPGRDAPRPPHTSIPFSRWWRSRPPAAHRRATAMPRRRPSHRVRALALILVAGPPARRPLPPPMPRAVDRSSPSTRSRSPPRATARRGPHPLPAPALLGLGCRLSQPRRRWTGRSARL